jgi:hypothetical protein
MVVQLVRRFLFFDQRVTLLFTELCPELDESCPHLYTLLRTDPHLFVEILILYAFFMPYSLQIVFLI